MPFGVVRGVGRGMGVLDGGGIVEGEGAVLRVNLGRPIVTNGALATRLFSNYFEDLLMLISVLYGTRKLCYRKHDRAMRR